MQISAFVDWLVLGSIGILFTSMVAIMALKYFQRTIRSWWLASFLGLGLSWTLIILVRFGLPKAIRLGDWQLVSQELQGGISISPLFLLDNISWMFSLVIISLGIGVVLTSVSRLDEKTWHTWLGTLALTALGTINILAGNPLTLILALTALDIVEFSIWSVQLEENANQKHLYAYFASRFTGTLLILVFTMVSGVFNESITMINIPMQFSPFIFLAAVLRVGVVPLYSPLLAVRSLSFDNAILLRMITLSTSIVILVRTAATGISEYWLSPFLFFTLIVFVIFAFRWFSSKDVLEARPFWIVTVISVSLLAALLAQPTACLVWGITAVLLGGFLYLGRVRTRSMLLLSVLASISITMLPFSPTWQVNSVFTSMWMRLSTFEAMVAIPLAFIGFSLFILGFLQHGLRIDSAVSQPERWVWLLYLPGLLFLLLLNYALGWINLPDLSNIKVLDWVTGVIVCGLAAGILVLVRKVGDAFMKLVPAVKFSINFIFKLFSLKWILSFFSSLHRMIRVPFHLLNDILEGEGGLLWSYLFLLMLLSLAFQIGLVR